VKQNRQLSIQEQIEQFVRGDFIDVLWLDAATVTAARVETLPLPNDYVETRRRSPGLFVCMQKGRTWAVPSLIILRDQTDDYRAEILSVPIPVVMVVRKMADKTKESMQKVDFFLHTRRRRNPMGKTIKRLHDGAVKVID
jgi:hypothetical protein